MSKDMLKSVDDAAARTGAEDPEPPSAGLWQRLKGWLGHAAPRHKQPAECLQELLPQEALRENGQQLLEDRKSMQMLGRLITFSGLSVEDVLVPRADIVAIAAQAPLAELMALFAQALHSRLPVYDETLDDIIGMVHIKDLLQHLHQQAQPVDSGDAVATQPDLLLPGQALAMPVGSSPLLRPVLYVPDSMPVADLLLKMQSTRMHMAIVIDEYGGTEGLVTIEDVVEQIVGEIADEHDSDEDHQQITPVPGGYVVSARLELAELERLLGVDLLPDEQDEEVDTVGGMLFTRLGRVPVKGEVVPLGDELEAEVLEADPRRVRKVRFRRLRRPQHLPEQTRRQG